MGLVRNKLFDFQVSKQATDRLALRMGKISMTDHYARLYGPVVMAHQVFDLSSPNKNISMGWSGHQSRTIF